MSFKLILVITLISLVAIKTDITFLDDSNAAEAGTMCAAVTCDSTENADCMLTSGTAAEKNLAVAVHSCGDKTKKVCDASTATGANTVFGKKVGCIATPAVPEVSGRYPGEACEKKENCLAVQTYDDATKAFVTTQECTANLCVGAADTKQCTNDSSCVVGFWCKKATEEAADGVCTAQVAATVECSATSQCLNNLVCNLKDKKCVALYSEKVGTELKGVYAENDQSLACATDTVHTGICANYVQGEKWAAACDKYGASCDVNFDFGDSKPVASTDMLCGCTWNSNEATCANLAGASANSVTQRDVANKLLNNKRHTSARFQGEIGSDRLACVLGYYGKYPGADTCVRTNLGYENCTEVSSAVMKFSLFAFALLFLA